MRWRPWQPPADEDAVRLHTAAALVAARFSSAWFGGGGCLTCRSVGRSGSFDEQEPSFDVSLRYGKLAYVLTTQAARLQLASLALQIHAAPGIDSADVSVILERLANEQIADLLQQLIQEIRPVLASARPGDLVNGEPGESPDDGLYEIEFGIQQIESPIRVRLAEELFHRSSSDGSTVTAALVSRADVVADLTVQVSATVGRASLRFEELASLAPGDVILLDRTIERPIELVGGQPAIQLGRAFPCRVGQSRALQFSVEADGVHGS